MGGDIDSGEFTTSILLHYVRKCKPVILVLWNCLISLSRIRRVVSYPCYLSPTITFYSYRDGERVLQLDHIVRTADSVFLEFDCTRTHGRGSVCYTINVKSRYAGGCAPAYGSAEGDLFILIRHG